MVLKVYQTLEEALEDIGFKQGMPYKLFRFSFHRKGYEQSVLDAMLKELNLNLELNSMLSDKRKESLQLFLDLTRNAYRCGVTQNIEYISSLFYIGCKGLLIGTKQDKNFLTLAQIELLKSSKSVQSTSNPPGGVGTKLMVELGDGILILESKMEIYLSMYSNLANLGRG